jgi:hypothetical protein
MYAAEQMRNTQRRYLSSEQRGFLYFKDRLIKFKANLTAVSNARLKLVHVLREIDAGAKQKKESNRYSELY